MFSESIMLAALEAKPPEQERIGLMDIKRQSYKRSSLIPVPGFLDKKEPKSPGLDDVLSYYAPSPVKELHKDHSKPSSPPPYESLVHAKTPDLVSDKQSERTISTLATYSSKHQRSGSAMSIGTTGSRRMHGNMNVPLPPTPLLPFSIPRRHAGTASEAGSVMTKSSLSGKRKGYLPRKIWALVFDYATARPDKHSRDRGPYIDANRVCVNLALTSKKFNSLVTPLLYRITALTTAQGPGLLSRTLDTRADLRSRIFALYFLPHASVDLGRSAESAEITQSLGSIFSKLTALHAMRVPPKLLLDNTILENLAFSAQTLQAISFGCADIRIALDLLKFLPVLTTLTLWSPYARFNPNESIGKRWRHDNLQSFTLLLGRDAQTSMQLVAQCDLPSLSQLTLTAHGSRPDDAVVDFLARNGQHLTHICLTGNMMLPRDILGYCPLVVALKLDGVECDELIAHSQQNLEFISVTDRQPASAILQVLDRNLYPNLRRVIACTPQNFLLIKNKAIHKEWSSFELSMAFWADKLAVRGLKMTWLES